MTDSNQIFIRSRTVVSRVVGGETLIVPVRGKVGDLASIYRFNGTGSLVWQLLDAPQSVADVATAVTREYAVEPEQAQKDVDDFVGEMLAVGLVEVFQPAMNRAGAQARTAWQAGSH